MNNKTLKHRTILCITLLSILSLLSAQSLSSQLNTIKSNHEMMGGSVVVFDESGIKESIAIGKADHGRNIAMTEDSKYRIASISKTITAIAVMQLIEDDLLELDANISTILGYTVKNPNYPSDSITVRMLLSHTSTIYDGSTYSSFMSATVNNNPIPNLSEILTTGGSYYTTAQFNNARPGSYFNYSNLNYVILGTIVEKVSGKRFDIYCKENISDPLDIDASFNVKHLNDIDQLAVLYRKYAGTWRAQVDDYNGSKPTYNNLDGYVPGTNAGRWGPQGGFRCSAKDLAKIFLCLMNGGTYDDVTLLEEETVNDMIANEWTYGSGNGNNYHGLFRSWGLGIHRTTNTAGGDIALPGSQRMLGHAGEAYGLVSDAYWDPMRKVGFIFLTNGVGKGYKTNSYSAFYTVEQQVFKAIEDYGLSNNSSTGTGSNHIEMLKQVIYPNPSADYVNIDSRNADELKIFALNGRQVKHIQLRNGHNRINIHDLSIGMYVLKTNNTRYSFIKK